MADRPSRRSVIDIGTNSVKLLVGDVDGERVDPVYENNRLTRLGLGLYDTGKLAPQSMLDTYAAVTEFVEAAKEKKSERLRIIATSATRDASNSAELLFRLEEISGITPEIITGQEEASLVLRGILTADDLRNREMLITDIGGGSTELILTRGKELVFQHSFQLGTVRMMEAIHVADPPSPSCLEKAWAILDQFFEEEINPRLKPLILDLDRPDLLTTGGTSTILARISTASEDFDPNRIESTILSDLQVKGISDRLWSLPLEERQKVAGLPANRADVMLAGALIYLAIFKHLGFSRMHPSTRGLRFGALL